MQIITIMLEWAKKFFKHSEDGDNGEKEMLKKEIIKKEKITERFRYTATGEQSMEQKTSHAFSHSDGFLCERTVENKTIHTKVKLVKRPLMVPPKNNYHRANS